MFIAEFFTLVNSENQPKYSTTETLLVNFKKIYVGLYTGRLIGNVKFCDLGLQETILIKSI